MHPASADKLAALLTAQYGVLSFQQAVESGCYAELPAREVTAGRWQQPHRGIYVAGAQTLTLLQHACCAKLGGGDCQRTAGPPGGRTSVLPARGHEFSRWAVS